jgi:hypothetical protein
METLVTGSLNSWITAALVAGTMLGGCGDNADGGSNTPAKTAPPAAKVSDAVVDIVNACIKISYNPNADRGKVSAATDSLITMSKRYDTTAQLKGETSIKAKTLREAMQQQRDLLRECSPDDAGRLDEALTAN